MSKWIDLIVQPNPIQVYDQDYKTQIQLQQKELEFLEKATPKAFVEQLEALFSSHPEARVLYCSSTDIEEGSFWWAREEQVLEALSEILKSPKISSGLAKRLEDELLTLLEEYLGRKKLVPCEIISLIGECLHMLLKYVLSPSKQLDQFRLSSKETLFGLILPTLLECFPCRGLSKSDQCNYLDLVKELINAPYRGYTSFKYVSPSKIHPKTFLNLAGYYVKYLSENGSQSIQEILMDYLDSIASNDESALAVMIPHVIISLPCPNMSEFGEQLLLEFLKYTSHKLSEYLSGLLRFHCYLCWRKLIWDYVKGSQQRVITRTYTCPPLNEMQMAYNHLIDGPRLVSCGAFNFLRYVDQTKPDLLTSEQKIAITNRAFNGVNYYHISDLRWWLVNLRKHKDIINLNSQQLQLLTDHSIGLIKKYIDNDFDNDFDERQTSDSCYTMRYLVTALVIGLDETKSDIPDQLVGQLYDSFDIWLDHPRAGSLMDRCGELVRLMEVTYRKFPSDRAWKSYDLIHQRALECLTGVLQYWISCYLTILGTNKEKLHSDKKLMEQLNEIVHNLRTKYQNLSTVEEKIESLGTGIIVRVIDTANQELPVTEQEPE